MTTGKIEATVNPSRHIQMYKKKKISKTLRPEVWYEWNGNNTSVKCPVEWCQNEITLDTCHMGHNIPESFGGPTRKENLVPICWMCNSAMKNNYTILEWSALPRSKRNREHIHVCAECHKPTGNNSTNHLVLCDRENCTRCYCLECLRISEIGRAHV